MSSFDVLPPEAFVVPHVEHGCVEQKGFLSGGNLKCHKKSKQAKRKTKNQLAAPLETMIQNPELHVLDDISQYCRSLPLSNISTHVMCDGAALSALQCSSLPRAKTRKTFLRVFLSILKMKNAMQMIFPNI